MAAGGTGGGSGSSGDACAPGPSPLLGWASVSGNSVTTTTGGDGGAKVSVSDLTALTNAVKGTDKQIIEISGSITGSIAIGSNKTLVGCSGAQFKGHISMNGSANVIVRNLKIVGNNCTDNPSDCSGGEDAITVQSSAHHIWFDHDDISDGSDGNLDLTHASDYVTISWTKFHYSGRRTDPAGAAGGHQFSNLIGHSDSNSSEDTGHLRITFHHDWWADNVVERMPRVRFGQVHIVNNLYTASGNDYCIGVGFGANILTENNIFIGVAVPINTTSYSDSASVIHSTGNIYTGTTGAAPADLRASSVFTPGYTYTPDSTTGLEAAIRSGAGPH
jgi:pectate lyase